MFLYYLIGAVLGAPFGYFVIYKWIGCSDGSCAITASPYMSTIFGVIMGVLIAGAVAPETKPDLSAEDPPAVIVEYKRITAEEAKARIDSGDNVVIVDVRTEAEYKSGYIPNAILIPNETITNEMPAQLPDLDAEILIYCRSGNRSAQAARKLITIGYTNVYDLGGIGSWPYDIVK